MDKDLEEALEELKAIHAVLWCHFDPTDAHGARKQPKDIQRALKRIRALLSKHGETLEGFRRGE